ncbi:hypothetical protein [Streptomyces sp. NPDC007355]|uniref:hypothetical protein n=1 Tax=Streptomyces sp. NPDC007355 TaxID=3364778 RepID=UPI00367489AA
MEPLPIPCPAGLIPDVTVAEAFSAAYRAAKEQRVVLVAPHRSTPSMLRCTALSSRP